MPPIDIDQREFPRMVDRPTYKEPIELEIPNYEWLNHWIWPASNWSLFIFNCFIMLAVLRDILWNGTYNPLTHFLSAAIIGMSIAILALIHKFILRK